MFRDVRAGFFRSHAAAPLAIKSSAEAKRRDSQFVRLEAEEFLLRVEGPVEAANSGMIAAHDEVRAAVVFARYGMEDGFARPRVAHRRGVHAEHCSRRGKRRADQSLVTTQADFR